MQCKVQLEAHTVRLNAEVAVQCRRRQRTERIAVDAFMLKYLGDRIVVAERPQIRSDLSRRQTHRWRSDGLFVWRAQQWQW